MDEAGNKSNWEALARDLGADVAEPAVDPTESTEEQTREHQTGEHPVEESSAQPRVVDLPDEPPRSAPPGWDSLADEFGIEVPTPAEPEAVAPQPISEPADVAEEPEAATSWQVAPEPTEVPEHLAESYDVESAEQDADDATGRPSGVEADVSDWSPTSSSATSDAPTSYAPTSHVPEPVAEQPTPAEPTSGKPAASFWESIFGTRPEPTVPAALGGAAGAPTDRASDDTADEIPFAEDELTDAETDTSEERTRRRPRRRRGRGRGREEQHEAEATRRGPSSRRESDTRDSSSRDSSNLGDDTPDDDLDDDGEDRAPQRRTRSRTGGHRNIPSWADAIDVIVDANLESRTTRRRSTTRSSGGRGGRPRGRRKKTS